MLGILASSLLHPLKAPPCDVSQLKADGIGRLVVLPLYPQFSISTSGSSLRLLEALFKADPQLSSMPHTVIPSWYQRPGYITAMADLIQVCKNLLSRSAAAQWHFKPCPV